MSPLGSGQRLNISVVEKAESNEEESGGRRVRESWRLRRVLTWVLWWNDTSLRFLSCDGLVWWCLSWSWNEEDKSSLCYFTSHSLFYVTGLPSLTYCYTIWHHPPPTHLLLSNSLSVTYLAVSGYLPLPPLFSNSVLSTYHFWRLHIHSSYLPLLPVPPVSFTPTVFWGALFPAAGLPFSL